MNSNHKQKPYKWELMFREHSNGDVEFSGQFSRRVVWILLAIIISILVGWQPQTWVETFLSK